MRRLGRISTVCLYKFYGNAVTNKKSQETPNIRNGLTQMIKMDKYTGQKGLILFNYVDRGQYLSYVLHHYAFGTFLFLKYLYIYLSKCLFSVNRDVF